MIPFDNKRTSGTQGRFLCVNISIHVTRQNYKENIELYIRLFHKLIKHASLSGSI